MAGQFLLDPSLANAPILYPMKKKEKLWFSGILQGFKMGTLTKMG